MIDYKISQDGLKIETYPKDVLDLFSTIDYFARIKKDQRIKQGAVEIVNFKNVSDFKISYLEIEKITRSYQQPKEIQKIKTTIFVCKKDIAYGIGRMLQTFHETSNPSHKVMIIRSENKLEEILKELS